MRKKEKKQYLKILELGEKASRDDIENAYSHFVKLYSSENSPEIHPLREEIRRDERKKILNDIDNAYKALVGEDAVNRIEFSAEIESQEIILDDDEETAKEHEGITPSEESEDGRARVVEHEFSDQPVVEMTLDESVSNIFESEMPDVDLPVVESIAHLNESEEQLFENAERELHLNQPTDGIEYQIIEVDENNPVENETGAIPVKDESDTIDPGGIEFEDDISVEDEGGEWPVENESEIIEHDEIVEDKVPAGADVEMTGEYIKKQREKRKLKARDIGELLNISYKDIVYIENEKFDKLNDPGYLRWVIKSYAKLLGIAEEKCTEDYMRRYRAKK